MANKQYVVPVISTSGGGGGAGTVTNTGALTANQLLIGNGGVDEKALGTLGTSTTVLHGNAGGAPTFAAVDLTTDVTGLLPSANNGVAVENATANSGGGFVGPGMEPIAVPTSTAAQGIISFNNQVRAAQFTLCKRTTIARGAVVCGAITTGKFGYAGVYSADKNTKLIECKFSADAATIVTSTITGGGSVTLIPGQYWYAFGSDDINTKWTVFTAGGLGPSLLFNTNFVRVGIAANAISSGALPSALGTISSVNQNLLMALFES